MESKESNIVSLKLSEYEVGLITVIKMIFRNTYATCPTSHQYTVV